MELLKTMISPIIGLAGAVCMILGATLAITAIKPSPAWHVTEDCAHWIETTTPAAFKEDRAQ